MSRRYDPRENAYIGKNPIKWYELTIWGMTANVKSDSAGAARYEAWLNFHDAYDIPFGEFCKQSKIRRAGGTQ